MTDYVYDNVNKAITGHEQATTYDRSIHVFRSFPKIIIARKKLLGSISVFDTLAEGPTDAVFTSFRMSK